MFTNEQIAIHATQYIINLLESSKSHSEEALDTLPVIYTVVDSQGQILKGNRSLAKLFDLDHENLLGLNMSQLFSKANWGIFQSHIVKTQNILNSQFKIDVLQKDGSIRNYLWSVSLLDVKRPGLPPLFSVLGNDVTELTRATEENSRMQFELSTAKIVQDTFFPPKTATFGKSSLASYYESANECGGDWWYYLTVKDKVYLLIGDVTGHGVSAALVVSAVHSVASFIGDREMTPSQILIVLNRAVSAMTGNPLVMTFLAASIDLKTHECSYASAGHEPIILLSHDKKKFGMQDLVMLEGATNSPLGIQKSSNYDEKKIQLTTGDRLLFYTDGVYDIANPAGDGWNRSIFYRTLAKQASASQNATDLISGLHKTIKDFRKESLLRDDITVFSFQV